MTDRRDDKAAPDSRDKRLGQALRANLARRKAQARAREAADVAGAVVTRAAEDDGQNKTVPDADGVTGKDS